MLTDTLIKYSSLFLRNVNKDVLRIFLESSPQYPNLMSVVQTLRYIGITVNAGQCDWEYLKNLDSPFLLHINKTGSEVLIIAKWDTRSARVKTFNHKRHKWINIDKNNIECHWDGVVLYTKESIIKQTFCQKTKFWMLILLASMITGILCYRVSCSIIPILIGLTLSLCLFLQSHTQHASTLERVCHVSKHSNCEQVYKSKYSTIMGVKLNTLALSYFIAQVISCVIGYISSIVNPLHSLYFVSGLVVFPVVIYSLYAQYKIKYICPLCLGVVFCLVAEAILFLSYIRFKLSWDILLIYSCSFMMSLGIIQYLSTIHIKEERWVNDRIRMLKVIRKPKTLISESTPIDPIISPVVLGEDNSLTKLTTVISPSCKHCRKTVKEVIALIERGSIFRWELILGQSREKDKDIIESWLTKYYLNKESFYQELALWSKGDDRIHTVSNGMLRKRSDIDKVKSDFCKQIKDLGITGFPRIIFNNQILSSLYSERELVYLFYDYSNAI